MAAVLVEWVELIARWLHVMAGIAWIGSSFYFVFLDSSLRKRAGLAEGVAGESWQVHGGGFYHMQKYMVAPAELPEELHWFKWEAYTTWMSGALMMVLVYYAGASLFLIDPAVRALDPRTAVLISLGTLAGGWIVYDNLCRSGIGQRDGRLAIVGFALLVFSAWGYTELFSGRAAFIHVGALVGTIMVANVFLVIIPNQRTAVAAMMAGNAPDPNLGREAKQRSLHNSYLTLPVVLTMISNHAPVAFDSRWNWLIMVAVIIAGGLIRHFFIQMHLGKGQPWWTWMAAALAMLVAIALSLPRQAPVDLASLPDAPFATVREIVANRCSVCHAADPSFRGLSAPPKGLAFDTPDDVLRSAALIFAQAGQSRAMPPGNVTEMTDDERELLRAWFLRGGSAE